VDSRKAEGMQFTINLITPDNGEKFAVEMSNSTLTSIKGQQASSPNLTVTLNRSDLELVMGGKATFDALIAAGKAKFEGDRKPFDQLRGTLVQFTPDFELMPGTKPVKAPSPQKSKDPLEVLDSNTEGIP
jgi:alkyl sulfatase BDS1-like metallo-beta-lactamase superfamily hydrolase